MYGMCEKCFGMIDLSRHQNMWWDDFVCINCGEKSHGIEIDEMILPTISQLNKKGYFTEYCCSGHGLDGRIGSISGGGVGNNFYIMFARGLEPTEHPKEIGIKIENDFGRIIYRKIFETDFDYFRISNVILEFNKMVYEWAKKLPERVFE